MHPTQEERPCSASDIAAKGLFAWHAAMQDHAWIITPEGWGWQRLQTNLAAVTTRAEITAAQS
jgi:hypothetical protein